METVRMKIVNEGRLKQAVRVPGGTITVRPGKPVEADILPIDERQRAHYKALGVSFTAVRQKGQKAGGRSDQRDLLTPKTEDLERARREAAAEVEAAEAAAKAADADEAAKAALAAARAKLDEADKALAAAGNQAGA